MTGRSSSSANRDPTEGASRAAAGRIARLRDLRAVEARGTREAAMGALFGAAGRTVVRDRKRLGNVGEAWAAACPREFVERTAIAGLSRGTLTVRVDDSATRFELDRLLRSGVEAEIIRACSAPVRRVKLVVGG